MKSPFPGMDPYLEDRWTSVHASLIPYIRDELNRRLPPNLRAEVEEGLIVESDDPVYVRTIYPDVHIEQATKPVNSESTAVLDLKAAEPVRVAYSNETTRQRVVEIQEVRGGKVVTAIELLSPANKRGGDDTRKYLQNTDEYLDAGVNVVEYDLLRDGRPPRRAADAVRAQRKADYAAVVFRPTGMADIYAFSLRDRIPVIQIPLTKDLPELVFDLQPLLDLAFRNGRYPIDYSRPCVPPLNEVDESWMKQLVGQPA